MEDAGKYRITTDRARMDVARIHQYLAEESYWARGVPLEVVQRSLENSLCFAILTVPDDRLAGFARVITDFATFAYLADVFVLDEHRGAGLSKWLVQTIVEHPGLQGLRRFMLSTMDAHGLYERYGGFERVPVPNDRWMQRYNADVYKNQ